MTEYLCATCANKDEAYVHIGNNYRLEEICIYDHGGFPKMAKCNEYTPEERADE